MLNRVLDKIREITGKDFNFYEVDSLNRKELEKVFEYLSKSLGIWPLLFVP